MVLFNLNPEENDSLIAEASRNPESVGVQNFTNDQVDSDRGHPGLLDNAPTAVGHGFESAAGGLMAVANKSLGFDFWTGLDKREYQGAFADTEKKLIPDPAVTGWLGNRILYPMASVLPQATVGWLVGGPAGAITTVGLAQGNKKFETSLAEGVDEKTAMNLGAFEGITQGAGAGIPASIPGSLMVRLTSGAAINVGMGVTQRAGTSEILKENGYDKMAAQYKVLDGGQMITDAVMGAAFGGLLGEEGHVMPSTVDTALAANDLNQLEVDSAPGIPTDPATRDSHIAAMKTAADQILKNEPVSVGDHFTDPNFLAKPEDKALKKDVQDVMDEEGITDLIKSQQEPVIEHPHPEFNVFAKDFPNDIPGQHDAAQAFVLKKGGENGNEHGLAVDEKTGQVTHTTTSELPNQLTLKDNPTLQKDLENPDNNIVFHHNHPRNRPLSPDGDITELVNSPGMSQVVAHGHEGGLSAASLTPETKVQFRAKPKREALNILRLAILGTKRFIGEQMMAIPNANLYDIEMTNRALHAAGVIDYKSNYDISKLGEYGQKIIANAADMIYDYMQKRGIIYDRIPGRTEPIRLQRGAGELYRPNDKGQANAEGSGSDRGSAGVSGKAPATTLDIGGQQVTLPNVEISGDPSNLNIKVTNPAGEAAPAGESKSKAPDITQDIVKEKPDLEVVDDNGEVMTVKEAMAKSKEELAQSEKDANLFNVAVSCFLRSGE